MKEGGSSGSRLEAARAVAVLVAATVAADEVGRTGGCWLDAASLIMIQADD